MLASAEMTEAVLLVEREAPARAHLSRQLADDGFAVFAAAPLAGWWVLGQLAPED